MRDQIAQQRTYLGCIPGAVYDKIITWHTAPTVITCVQETNPQIPNTTSTCNSS